MPENVETLEGQDLENSEAAVVENDGSLEENANLDSLRPGGGTAGAGDSKAQKIAAIVTNLTSLSDDDLNGFHKSIAQIGKEADGVGDVAGKNKSSIAAKPSSASADAKKIIKEELTALFAGEDGLSESFVDQATSLFEAAVTTRVVLETARIEEDFDTRLAESTETMVSEFAERMDTYGDYVADKFISENQIAIDSGIKAQLTESFISGLRDLFAEHYVDVPEDKVDIVEALTAELEETREQLNTSINENIELAATSERAVLGAALNEAVEGLSEADADRLKDLSEDLDYTDVADFSTKVKMIRERIFEGKSGNTTGLVIEEVGLDDNSGEDVDTNAGDPQMNRYVSQIKADASR